MVSSSMMRCQTLRQSAAANGSSGSVAPPPTAATYRAAPATRRRAVCVRASDGVQDLLARDRKRRIELAPEFDEPAAAPAAPATDEAAADADDDDSSNGSGRMRGGKGARRFKSRQQRRRDMAAGVDAAAAAAAGPRRCKEAVDEGLRLFAAGDHAAAVEAFNLALELPGNGAYRLPGSPREYLCPSDAEENACLYNLACCYAQMGQRDAALTCVEAALENGFDDVATLRADPDLAPLRGPELERLIDQYTGLPAKVLGVFKRSDAIEADPNRSRPWWEVRW